MPLRIIICFCLITCLAGCSSAPKPKPQNSGAVDSYFKQGDNLFQQQKYDDAISQWKKVKESGIISPEISAMADLRIADAQFENKSYIEAGAAYESFQKFHPRSVKAPYAMFRHALCYYNQVTTIDRDQAPIANAVTMFENFLNKYPQSEYAAEARAKLDDCLNKQAEYELYIGRFYYHFGRFKAAAKRLEECIAKYPRSTHLDEAFLYLENAYLKIGEKDKARETYNRFAFRFPTSKYLKDAEKDLNSKSWMPF